VQLAGEPGNQALSGYGQDLDGLDTDCSQAGVQAKGGEPMGRLGKELGDGLLLALAHPVPDHGG
jgi:hypothetical protein